MRVAVGLSGGVDSAVAAALLKEAGHEVIGVTMTTYDGRPLDVPPDSHGCYGPGEAQDVDDAARIAGALGIPFVVIDLAAEFTRAILDPCMDAYRAGATPNPCVACNQALKFGLVPERLRARGIGVDRFATGHYARVTFDPDRGRYLLKRGLDTAKDQSYFLYRLTQAQLRGALFPLGELRKEDVRRRAAALGLSAAGRSESQDFIAGGYHAVFGGEAAPGPIVDTAGKRLGTHQGIQYFTIGQRRGIRVPHTEALYVVAIDAQANRVIVGTRDALYRGELSAGACRWIAVERLEGPMRVEARIRYRHAAAPALLTPLGGGGVKVVFDAPQRAVTPGQAVVFYDGDMVIGGGTIERCADGG